MAANSSGLDVLSNVCYIGTLIVRLLLIVDGVKDPGTLSNYDEDKLWLERSR